MHKSFYVSGFLYHQPSQQILLQQISSLQNHLSQWFLFGESYKQGAYAEKIFQNIIYQQLGLEIKNINSVYSYENDNANYSIFYSEIKKLSDFPGKNDRIFQWLSFKNIPKLHISAQTKHDIVIAQRVIDSINRKNTINQTNPE